MTKGIDYWSELDDEEREAAVRRSCEAFRTFMAAVDLPSDKGDAGGRVEYDEGYKRAAARKAGLE
jgi:hypothetical protein